MNDLHLFSRFQPKHYDLHITIDREKRHFTGTVAISGRSTDQSDGIYLHTHKLHIISASIDGRPAQYQHGEHDTLVLTTTDFKPGEHSITLEYEADITDPMHGLYPCYFTLDGQKEELLATQFESHHARDVFPCVDEPEAKATFDLTLTTEAGISVISNTPITEQHEADEKLTTRFETTPVMSTYLLAWVIGKLTYEERTTKDGVTIRAYATPANKRKLAYAVDEAVRCMELLNAYFDTPYPLTKCDLVAVPDFSAGAMENWGCITFRESILLVDEHSATHTRQYTTRVIAHELAHQWFGDLVTMKWWNDLWLNESFANLMEFVASSELHPNWDLMTKHFEDETQHAFHRDALASVQKIQQEVHDPSEIETLFDPAIVYAKGGSLLHMLHTFLGADNFRDGLRVYLKRHQYTNTTASDLWQALSEVSGRDVAAFMTPWITQSGFPVVTTGVSDRTVNLHQQRFLSSPKATVENQTLWPIPLLSDQLQETLLAQPSASLSLRKTDRPLLLNQGRTGYYMSLYDQAHLEKLRHDVQNDNLAVVDRLGLLADNLNLAKAGLQTFTTALNLLEAYRNESSQPVWSAITAYIGSLKTLVDDDKVQLTQLRQFVRKFARKQYERLDWEVQADESYYDTLLRPMIIAHMAYGRDDEVTTHLRDMFRRAETPTDITADLRSITLATAIRHGNDNDFQKALTWHASSDSAEQRNQIVAGLCATRNSQHVETLLQLLTTDAVRLQDLFHWVGHLARNRHARDATWQWLQKNWQWITDQYGNDFHYTSFPKYIASAFSRPEQLASFKAFFMPLQEAPALKRTITQSIEDIEGRVLWREREAQAVAQYLAAQK